MRGYELALRVNGEVPDISLGIASRPVLTEEDAIFLLTTGATPAGIKQEGLSGALISRAGELLGRSFVDSNGDPDKETFADRFDLEVGREISESGRYTVEMEYKLIDRWYLRAEQDRYDAYNLGGVWKLRFR